MIGADCAGHCNWVDCHGNILFHFDPRPSEQAIVLNSKLSGRWGLEVRIPLRVATAQNIVVDVTADAFEIFVEGVKQCTFPHRQAWSTFKDIELSSNSNWTANFRRVESDLWDSVLENPFAEVSTNSPLHHSLSLIESLIVEFLSSYKTGEISIDARGAGDAAITLLLLLSILRNSLRGLLMVTQFLVDSPSLKFNPSINLFWAVFDDAYPRSIEFDVLMGQNCAVHVMSALEKLSRRSVERLLFPVRDTVDAMTLVDMVLRFSVAAVRDGDHQLIPETASELCASTARVLHANILRVRESVPLTMRGDILGNVPPTEGESQRTRNLGNDLKVAAF